MYRDDEHHLVVRKENINRGKGSSTHISSLRYNCSYFGSLRIRWTVAA